MIYRYTYTYENVPQGGEVRSGALYAIKRKKWMREWREERRKEGSVSRKEGGTDRREGRRKDGRKGGGTVKVAGRDVVASYKILVGRKEEEEE
jgi:hypothetical protein